MVGKNKEMAQRLKRVDWTIVRPIPVRVEQGMGTQSPSRANGQIVDQGVNLTFPRLNLAAIIGGLEQRVWT